MADTALKEEAIWEEIIRLIETTDTVIGGENGVPNIAPRQLANRTLYLKKLIEKHLSDKNPHSQYANKNGDISEDFNAKNIFSSGKKCLTEDSIPKIDDATEKSKGIVQKAADSEVKGGEENTKFITSKQLKEKIDTTSLDVPVYQGADVNNLSFPVGSYVHCTTSLPKRNQHGSVYLSSDAKTFLTSSGTKVNGIWAQRGFWADIGLMQRIY